MTDLKELKGVGEAIIRLLHKVGLYSQEDIIENVPRKYDDYSHVQPIRSIRPGSITIKARITQVKGRYSKKGLHITEATATDDSGSVRIMWFNQPYRAQSVKTGANYYISGEFAKSYKYLVVSNPTCELVSNFPLHTARLVPIYKLTKGLTAHTLRKITKQAFDKATVNETLPTWLRKSYGLIGRHSALFSMHFPESLDGLAKAKRRIGFEELFTLSLASEMNKQDFARDKAQIIPFQESEIVSFVKSLPFSLTSDQRVCAWQILQDMTEGTPMNRLLEGDVGSGKTVVAAIAMTNASYNGMQSALMAPTEILAAQHMSSLQKILPVELTKRIVFLSGSMTNQQKVEANKAIASGEALLVVGTHAIIQEHVEFHNLALVVIDEQHRFGVDQRKALQEKAHQMPHVLHMTATPIPRSIALTLYGEMDVSLLKEKPAGRIQIESTVVLAEERQRMYESCKEILDEGRQMFVVCPKIDENEPAAGRSLSVEHIAKQLRSWLKDETIEILHGRMKADEKEQIMSRFAAGDLKILVSTTVIEVGVDIPNASIMVIEGADRFGLAQLHQLRGRVGRGGYSGHCFFVTIDNGPVAKRLQLITHEQDGFKLSEYDLELRGPGAIYGTVQHGALDLRVAKITDTKLISEARRAARQYILKSENLLEYPELHAKVARLRTITNLN